MKAHVWHATRVRDELLSLPGVTGVHVADLFVRTLREVVAARGRPSWEAVLTADSADARPAARTGLAGLVDQVWERLDERIRSVDGVVLLHDATPLARYPRGMELLTRLASAARQSDERPYGLWLLCPMDAPRNPALLDAETVAVLGENEQLAVPRGFVNETDGELVTVRAANADPDFKRRSVTDVAYARHIRNIYKVLLTRGMVGTLIYAADPQTQEFLAELLGTPRPSAVGDQP